MKNISLLLILLSMCSVVEPCLFAAPASSKTIGVAGQTYAIAEEDAMSEIEAKLRSTDWSKVIDKKKVRQMVMNYKPKGLKHVPRATSDNVYTVDMTYTLDSDIRGRDGSVVYPKGYTYNLLQYITFPRKLVFINAEDKVQVNWFRSSGYLKDISTMLAITEGAYYSLAKSLGIPVYYASDKMIEKFNIRHVPAVVMQNGYYMEVHEYDPEPASKVRH